MHVTQEERASAALDAAQRATDALAAHPPDACDGTQLFLGELSNGDGVVLGLHPQLSSNGLFSMMPCPKAFTDRIVSSTKIPCMQANIDAAMTPTLHVQPIGQRPMYRSLDDDASVTSGSTALDFGACHKQQDGTNICILELENYQRPPAGSSVEVKMAHKNILAHAVFHELARNMLNNGLDPTHCFPSFKQSDYENLDESARIIVAGKTRYIWLEEPFDTEPIMGLLFPIYDTMPMTNMITMLPKPGEFLNSAFFISFHLPGLFSGQSRYFSFPCMGLIHNEDPFAPPMEIESREKVHGNFYITTNAAVDMTVKSGLPDHPDASVKIKELVAYAPDTFDHEFDGFVEDEDVYMPHSPLDNGRSTGFSGPGTWVYRESCINFINGRERDIFEAMQRTITSMQLPPLRSAPLRSANLKGEQFYMRATSVICTKLHSAPSAPPVG